MYTQQQTVHLLATAHSRVVSAMQTLIDYPRESVGAEEAQEQLAAARADWDMLVDALSK